MAGLETMRLRHSPSSPFVRKVLSFAHECGLADRIEIVPTQTWDPATDLVEDNPLGRIPTLITKDGTFIGSLFCCEYLDTLHGGMPLIPPAGSAEWPAMKCYWLADGILEAAVASVTELNQRPAALIYQPYLDRQRGKIESALAMLAENLLPEGERAALWELTLGCALGYLDFRLSHIDWRSPYPALSGFYDRIMARPSMQATWPRARAPQTSPPGEKP
jgi:glutathione S-transferase